MKKRTTFIAALMAASIPTFSQDFRGAKPPAKQIFQYVAHMPEAEYNVNEYLAKSIHYPTDAMRQNISGRVVLRFVIAEDGAINDVMVQRSVYPSIDSEAVRVVRSMPKWKPGRNSENEPVKVFFTIPIKFSFSDNSTPGGGPTATTPYYIPPIAAKDPISGPVLSYAEEMPDPGVNINTYISSQVTRSNIEELVGTKGRVVMKFIVTDSGDLDSFAVVKSLNPIVDTMVITILDNMPLWKPAINEGKPVNVYYTVSIPFNFTTDTSHQQPLTQNSIAGTRSNDSIYSYVEQMPEAGYDVPQYLARSLSYPGKARREKTEGRVVLRFVITKTGKLENVIVQQGVSPELDAEAIRVIKAMPDWKPARHNNEPVDVYFTLPIKFSLN